jgi:hypothetical protein
MTKISDVYPEILTQTTKRAFGNQVIEETGIDGELSAYESALLGLLKQIADNTAK